jgi:hypothetical protein
MVKRWFLAHRALLFTAVGTIVVAAVIATVAVVSTGYAAQRLDLGDGSVWVPNGSAQVIGRANTQVYGLDTVVTSTGSDIQVVQRGSTVLLFDHTNAKVDIVDPATSKVLDSVPLPPQDPLLFIAGGNVVVGSGGTGELWIMPIAQLANFDAQAQPTLSLGANLVTSVTSDGVLFAFSRTTRQVYRVDAADSDSVSATSDAKEGGTDTRFTITSVGGHWVILDPDDRRLYTEGGTIDLSGLVGAGRSPVLQQASSGGDSVLVGYDGGLVRAPLSGGSPQRVVSGQSGTAVAPTVVGDCSYAAWSGGGAWRQCGTSTEDDLTLKGVTASSTHLAFASNGTSVVLNDARLGTTWAVQQNAQLIDNWSDLITVKQDQQIAQDNTEDTPPDYDKTQSPPVAVNDDFGARPSRTSVLPVLLNDYDSNGDVLVITDFTPIDASIGHIDLINNNQQLQVTLVDSASGSFSFGYTISDGRGGSASAVVSVTVRLPTENSPPVQVRSTKALVAQGGRVTTSVLGDWVDPDGDAFYLASATTPTPDAVSYKPEGSVVFTEGGASPSVRSVVLVVSDGTASGTGALSVTVKSAGQVPIIADPFVVLTYSGQETTVSPLDHVRGGTGTLRLASVPAKTGATITASLETGTFRFTSTQVGTYYLEYVINDGDKTATGLVRIDVAAPPDVNTKPITIPKTVFIKTLSSQTIDVASTDIDPAGGVLLVTGVYNIAADAGIRAEVIDERAIRVTLVAPLKDGPVSFNYRITNGLASAEGIVTVVEIAPPTQLQPPIANDDSVTVRVGDAIDIPVLDNDVQPDGEPLTLNPQLTTSLGGSSGLLFASGQVLRYLAPDRTGDFTAIYEISQPDGQVAQAQVKIAVREAVASTNNPPVPVTVTARVLAGETVTIPIPLTGIDPDGDSVQLLGQATGPQKGSVTNVGVDTMDYQAGDYSSGTDSFTYTVVDSLGARATGTVRVGISPKVEGARNPVAIEDAVTMRPGGTVSVQVLANDSDPDGGTLTVTKVVPNTKNITASIVGDVVKVTPPATPGTYGLVYTIRNDFGGTSSNFITVTVDPNAPRAFPVASDTVLTLTDILDRDSIDVNVLRNVFFADGNVSSLRVSVLPGYENAATVTASKRIHVTIERKSQIIPFAVANPDDARVVAYAFVWVPGLDDALPQLNRKATPLSVASESTLTIDLDDYVLAVGGKQVRLTDTTSVQATHSNGDALVVNNHTLRFTSAEKYFGPASISFEVTDGTSASDPNGHTATLVLPIKVTARTNQPPVFIGGVIDFEPAESKVLDLSKLTNYPYPDDEKELQYTVLNPQPTGFTYTLTGQKLTIRADASTPKGSTTAVLIGVSDSVAAGQSGRIQLNVVSSSLPLASPQPDTVLAPRGQTVSVDVLANDEAANPFPGQPLRVVGIRGLGGSALPAGLSISPSSDNSRLTVTASADAAPGNTSLQYQVADATDDPARYVWGSVTVSVQDRPDPVTGITATSFGDKVVSLRWSAGPDNNSPITGFDVLEYGADGGLISTTPCAAAICDITTPGNGPNNSVRFSVVAKNAIGSSDPASLGSAIWSDIIPPAPSSITTAPLDGGLRITWRAVTTPGSGSTVDDYRVTAGGTVLDLDPSVCGNTNCTTDVSGLTNGQQVTVTVSARNDAYAALATWNSSSTSGTPAGRPIAVGAPVAAAADSTISVTWPGIFDPNGRAIDSYIAVVYPDDGTTPTCDNPGPGGSTQHQVSGSTTSTSFPGLSNEQRYLVLVLATNSQGCSASSSAAARIGPAIVTAKSSSGPTASGAVYNFILTGATVGSITANTDYSFYYRLTGDGTPTEHGPISLGDLLTADAGQYGSPQTVQLRACKTFPDAGTLCQSQWSENFSLGTPVNPQVGGLVFAPDNDGTNNGTFTWTAWPTGSGYTKVEYRCSAIGNFTEATDLTQAGSCHATPGLLSPTLTLRVTANGDRTYLITYDASGNVQ